MVRKNLQEAFENNIKIIDYFRRRKFENIPTKTIFKNFKKKCQEKFAGKSD